MKYREYRSPIFLMIKPQMGENIGAAARILSNFGFNRLEIVTPRDGWPNGKANAMAANGEFVIHNTIVHSSIEEALCDKSVIFAAAARMRDIKKEVLTPELAARKIVDICWQGEGVAVMFGPENSGLSNHEISFADSIITISTSPINASMNLAHSIAIIAYEIFKIFNIANSSNSEFFKNDQRHRNKPSDGVKRSDRSVKTPKLATKNEIEILLQKIIEQLEKRNFFRIEAKRNLMKDNIRNTLIQSKLDTQQLQIWHRIIDVLSSSGKEYIS